MHDKHCTTRPKTSYKEAVSQAKSISLSVYSKAPVLTVVEDWETDWKVVDADKITGTLNKIIFRGRVYKLE